MLPDDIINYIYEFYNPYKNEFNNTLYKIKNDYYKIKDKYYKEYVFYELKIDRNKYMFMYNYKIDNYKLLISIEDIYKYITIKVKNKFKLIEDIDIFIYEEFLKNNDVNSLLNDFLIGSICYSIIDEIYKIKSYDVEKVIEVKHYKDIEDIFIACDVVFI